MFKVGDYVVYRNNGVCKVESIGAMDLPGVSSTKLYYTLVPIYSRGSKVYTPTDNQKVLMRPVISKEEASYLLEHITDVEMLRVKDEKCRDVAYKEALSKCECREWVKIIKTLYLRKKDRLAEGKKVSANDEKYLRIAEDNLYGELAIPLEMEKDQVEQYIVEKVKITEQGMEPAVCIG